MSVQSPSHVEERDAFWAPWEGDPLLDLPAVDSFIRAIARDFPNKSFAWRGVVNAEWALHSSLYRRLLWTQREASPGCKPPTERQLLEAEAKVTSEARRWGIHSGPRGRLSFLELLATLQHFGAPTRLLDVTFNPYAALFFAVESEADDGVDGRLFAIDVTDRLINSHATLREWEHNPEPPWAEMTKDWTSQRRSLRAERRSADRSPMAATPGQGAR